MHAHASNLTRSCNVTGFLANNECSGIPSNSSNRGVGEEKGEALFLLLYTGKGKKKPGKASFPPQNSANRMESFALDTSMHQGQVFGLWGGTSYNRLHQPPPFCPVWRPEALLSSCRFAKRAERSSLLLCSPISLLLPHSEAASTPQGESRINFACSKGQFP